MINLVIQLCNLVVFREYYCIRLHSARAYGLHCLHTAATRAVRTYAALRALAGRRYYRACRDHGGTHMGSELEFPQLSKQGGPHATATLRHLEALGASYLAWYDSGNGGARYVGAGASERSDPYALDGEGSPLLRIWYNRRAWTRTYPPAVLEDIARELERPTHIV
mgnify:CR=1 FL=1